MIFTIQNRSAILCANRFWLILSFRPLLYRVIWRPILFNTSPKSRILQFKLSCITNRSVAPSPLLLKRWSAYATNRNSDFPSRSFRNRLVSMCVWSNPSAFRLSVSFRFQRGLVCTRSQMTSFNFRSVRGSALFSSDRFDLLSISTMKYFYSKSTWRSCMLSIDAGVGR